MKDNKWWKTTIFDAFFGSRRWNLLAYGGIALMLGLILTDVWIVYLMNGWTKDIFDVLSTSSASSGDRSQREYWGLLGKLLKIILLCTGIATASGITARLYAIAWRKAVTEEYMDRLRAIQSSGKELPKEEAIGQRIEQNVPQFIDIVWALGTQSLRGLLTLSVMIPILWHLSVKITEPLNVPGSLVALAVVFNIVAFFISKRAGSKLSALNYRRDTVNAALREVIAEQRLDEESVRPRIEAVVQNGFQLTIHNAALDATQHILGQIPPNLPWVVVGVGVFAGKVALGTLTQIAHAFVEVNNSVAFFTRNWATFASLKSTWTRLRELDGKIQELAMTVEE